MTDLQVVRIKRSDEENARNGVLFERDFAHAQANPQGWPDGEVFIADEAEYVVAYTPGISAALSAGRFVKIGKVERAEIDPHDVAATDAARKLAQKADVDLAEVPPTGADGQVVVDDVKKFIQRSKDESGG